MKDLYIKKDALTALSDAQNGFVGHIPLTADMKSVASHLAHARDEMALLNGLVNVKFRRPNAFEVDFKGLQAEIAFQWYCRKLRVLTHATPLFAVTPPPGADCELKGGAIIDIKGYLSNDTYFRINADKHRKLAAELHGYAFCRECEDGQSMEVHWFRSDSIEDLFKLKDGPYKSPYFELKAPALTCLPSPDAPKTPDSLTAALLALGEMSAKPRDRSLILEAQAAA